MRYALLIGITVTIMFSHTSWSAVWYVDKGNVSGVENGTSWATAFRTIQPAVDIASNMGGGVVHVAAGRYDERRTSIVNEVNTGSLVMHDFVVIEGGYAPDEIGPDNRDWLLYETIIDGTTARDGASAYHVVLGDDSCTLDGFIITGANIDTDFWLAQPGGGMYNDNVSPTVKNCWFMGNIGSSGGAMLCYRSSAIITHCRFTDNVATNVGGIDLEESDAFVSDCFFSRNRARAWGALRASNGKPKIIDCIFEDNEALSRGAVGIGNTSGQLPELRSCLFRNNRAIGAGDSGNAGAVSLGRAVVADCLFVGNSSINRGGAISASGGIIENCIFTDNSARIGGSIGVEGLYNIDEAFWYVTLSVASCTFWGNTATESGGGAYLKTLILDFRNNILWGNGPDDLVLKGTSEVAIVNNDIDTTTYDVFFVENVNENNIDADPLFVDAENEDFHLTEGSPCIDTGTAGNAPDTDYDGVSRPQGDGFDMGAFEYLEGAEGEGEGEGEGEPPPFCCRIPDCNLKSNLPVQKAGFPVALGDTLVLACAALALFRRRR